MIYKARSGLPEVNQKFQIIYELASLNSLHQMAKHFYLHSRTFALLAQHIKLLRDQLLQAEWDNRVNLESGNKILELQTKEILIRENIWIQEEALSLTSID